MKNLLYFVLLAFVMLAIPSCGGDDGKVNPETEQGSGGNNSTSETRKTLKEILLEGRVWRSPVDVVTEKYTSVEFSGTAQMEQLTCSISSAYPNGYSQNDYIFTECVIDETNKTISFNNVEGLRVIHIVSYDESSFTLDNGQTWVKYDKNNSNGFEYQAGDKVPSDFMDHPDWYGFKAKDAWKINENATALSLMDLDTKPVNAQVQAYQKSNYNLFAVEGYDIFYSGEYETDGIYTQDNYQDNAMWIINQSYLIHTKDGNKTTVVVGNKPILTLSDGKALPFPVQMYPSLYGFQQKDVLAVEYSETSGSNVRFQTQVWDNGRGSFVYASNAGAESWKNVFHEWKSGTYSFKFHDGMLETKYEDKLWKQNFEGGIIYILDGDNISVEKVFFDDERYRTFSLNSSAAPYNNALGIYSSFLISFRSYPYLSDENIHVTCPSWITHTKTKYEYGDPSSYLLYFADSKNTGSDRTGTITISITGLDKDYSVTYTINQQGDNSGGDNGGGNNDGDDSKKPVWGKVKGTIRAIGPGVIYSDYAIYADGQTTTVDYVYYPSTDTYYVYGGAYDSHPNANGGKGLRYDAQKGPNTIAIHLGSYYDRTMKIMYDWELRLHVTLP